MLMGDLLTQFVWLWTLRHNYSTPETKVDHKDGFTALTVATEDTKGNVKEHDGSDLKEGEWKG